MIAARNLTKQYSHHKAVDDVSFAVAEGENLVILGTSGCGKTTTLRMINRLISPDAGQVLVHGTDISRQQPDDLRRGIGYVLQHNSLFPHYTVAQNIAVVPQLLKWDKARIKQRTEELLMRLHLPPGRFLHKYPGQLSGGQQQRVNIARALAADPPILLMDEPFGALDTVTRTSIAREFSAIEAFMNKTIVMVTHDVQEAFMIGDRICLMSEGRIVQIGKPLELLFHPANDFVRAFFAGSYLRLAMGAIPVADLWDDLPARDIPWPAGTEIRASDSVWHALEVTFVRSNRHIISVQHASGAIKCVTKEDLYDAFSKYKIT